MKGTKEKGNEVMNRWEERSKDFIGSFLELFGRDGRIVSEVYFVYWTIKITIIVINTLLTT